MSTDFVPTVFRDLGKTVKDLFGKKYDFHHTAQLKTKTADGLTVTSKTQLAEAGKEDDKLVSTVTAKFDDKTWGNVEAQVDTNVAYKGTLKLSKLYKGVTVQATAEKKPSGTVQVDYVQAGLAATLNTTVGKDTTLVGGAAVVGFEGLSVGGQVDYDVKASAVKDFNAAFQFLTAAKDFELTVKTAKKTDFITISGLHKYSAAATLAAQIELDVTTGTPSSSVTFGGSYKLDADTVVQAKTKTTKDAAVVSAVWERVLGASTKLAVSTEFEVTNLNLQKQKLGLALSLGEVSE